MKLLKIKEREYTDLVALLERAELVDRKAKTAYPDAMYVNRKTYDKIVMSTKKVFRKQNPGIKKNMLEYSVNMHLLNLAPNICQDKGLMDGYALILPCKCEGTAG